MPSEIALENATRLWREFARRWTPGGPMCSIDVLFHAGGLKVTRAVGMMRDIERRRPDLARRIASGEAVRIHSSIDGEMIVQQPATMA